MAENLNEDSHTIGNSQVWGDADGAYLSNIEQNCISDKYGRLYDRYAAVDMGNKVSGWHLPTDSEWKTLEMHLGMSSSADNVGWRGTDQGTSLKKVVPAVSMLYWLATAILWAIIAASGLPRPIMVSATHGAGS